MKSIQLVLFLTLVSSLTIQGQKVFKVGYESQADLKIFIVKYESQAGWQNQNKQFLLL